MVSDHTLSLSLLSGLDPLLPLPFLLASPCHHHRLSLPLTLAFLDSLSLSLSLSLSPSQFISLSSILFLLSFTFSKPLSSHLPSRPSRTRWFGVLRTGPLGGVQLSRRSNIGVEAERGSIRWPFLHGQRTAANDHFPWWIWVPTHSARALFQNGTFCFR